jgi:hypothetical protein
MHVSLTKSISSEVVPTVRIQPEGPILGEIHTLLVLLVRENTCMYLAV